MALQSPRLVVEIRFSPNAELICDVRSFVSSFCTKIFAAPELASRIALTAHELLENALKYSVDGEIRVVLEVDYEGPGTVSVQTWNRAHASHIDTLKAIVEKMSGASDALQDYQLAMHKTSKQNDRSVLGLARIRSEALMSLTQSIDGEWVSVRAQTGLDRS